MKRLAIYLARASAIVVMGGLLALRGVRERARQLEPDDSDALAPPRGASWGNRR